MKRIRNFAVLSAFVALAGTSAYAQDEVRAPHRHHKEVTKEQAMQKAAKRFEEADRDHDGKLSSDEMKQAREQMRQRMQERRMAREQKMQERQRGQ